MIPIYFPLEDFIRTAYVADIIKATRENMSSNRWLCYPVSSDFSYRNYELFRTFLILLGQIGRSVFTTSMTICLNVTAKHCLPLTFILTVVGDEKLISLEVSVICSIIKLKLFWAYNQPHAVYITHWCPQRGENIGSYFMWLYLHKKILENAAIYIYHLFYNPY